MWGRANRKNAQQFLVAYDGGIVIELHNLGVAGAVGAHVVVRRISQAAAHVADGRVGNAFYLPESALHTPKAPGSAGGRSCNSGGFAECPVVAVPATYYE